LLVNSAMKLGKVLIVLILLFLVISPQSLVILPTLAEPSGANLTLDDMDMGNILDIQSLSSTDPGSGEPEPGAPSG